MRTFFVVNPTAGKGKCRQLWSLIQPHLSSWGNWTYAYTCTRGQATQLTRDAVTEGYDRIVALGGDGTLSEVVNGLFGTPAALGVIPAGTGNDFARWAGIPSQPVQAARLAMTGSARPVDVGEVTTQAGSRYFLNVAGFGFDAEVAGAVNQYPKYLGGTLPYILGILRTLWHCRPVHVQLVMDGRCFERTILLGAVANGRYYGGGMLIAPEACADDGLFDICLAGNLGPGAVLRLLPKLYLGAHKSHPLVEFFRCRELQIRSARPVNCQADGELAGGVPLVFRIHPGGIRCVTCNSERAVMPSPSA